MLEWEDVWWWNKNSYLKARQEKFKHKTFSLPFGLSPSPSQPMCIVHLHPALTTPPQWQKYLFNLKDPLFSFWRHVNPYKVTYLSQSLKGPRNPPLTLYVHTSRVNSIYEANISFPLKIVIGAEQTGQTTWGDTGQQPLEVLSWNTYLCPYNVGSYITCILPILQDYCVLHY